MAVARVGSARVSEPRGAVSRSRDRTLSGIPDTYNVDMAASRRTCGTSSDPGTESRSESSWATDRRGTACVRLDWPRPAVSARKCEPFGRCRGSWTPCDVDRAVSAQRKRWRQHPRSRRDALSLIRTTTRLHARPHRPAVFGRRYDDDSTPRSRPNRDVHFFAGSPMTVEEGCGCSAESSIRPLRPDDVSGSTAWGPRAALPGVRASATVRA